MSSDALLHTDTDTRWDYSLLLVVKHTAHKATSRCSVIIQREKKGELTVVCSV